MEYMIKKILITFAPRLTIKLIKYGTFNNTHH